MELGMAQHFALLPFLPSGHMQYCSENVLQLHKYEHFPLRLLNVLHYAGGLALHG